MTGEEKAIVYTDNIHIEYNEILSRTEGVYEITEEAEQFISEVEK